MASEPIRGGQTDVPEFYRTCAMFYDRDYAEILREGIDFYVALGLEFGGPALEMGCGTGRVLLPTPGRNHNLRHGTLGRHDRRASALTCG